VRGKNTGVRLGLLALALAFLAVGCGTEAAPDEKGANALEITRADGSRVQFADRIQAWCGWWGDLWGDPIPPSERVPTLQVVGGELSTIDATKPTAYWMFARSIEDIERARSFELPDDQVPDDEQGHATLYVFDPKTMSDLSSYESGSSGNVVVEMWGCRRGDGVRISVDATLDSEGHAGDSLTKVRGQMEAVIGERPQLPD
jgi:hypothetical protein